MKFLIVDDSATMRRIVINSLRRIFEDFDYVEADSGDAAVEVIRQSESVFAAITFDWVMPGMPSHHAVTAIREMVDTPILMVTTRSVREDIVLAAQAGVNNYVVKPFTPQVLKEKLEQMGVPC